MSRSTSAFFGYARLFQAVQLCELQYWEQIGIVGRDVDFAVCTRFVIVNVILRQTIHSDACLSIAGTAVPVKGPSIGLTVIPGETQHAERAEAARQRLPDVYR